MILQELKSTNSIFFFQLKLRGFVFGVFFALLSEANLSFYKVFNQAMKSTFCLQRRKESMH